ncbi:hypothetical protein CsSME_00028624 [Camellia sinensis var. sinensis]
MLLSWIELAVNLNIRVQCSSCFLRPSQICMYVCVGKGISSVVDGRLMRELNRIRLANYLTNVCCFEQTLSRNRMSISLTHNGRFGWRVDSETDPNQPVNTPTGGWCLWWWWWLVCVEGI